MSALHCFHCGGDCLPWACDRDQPTPEELVGQPMISSGWSVINVPLEGRLRRFLRLLS